MPRRLTRSFDNVALLRKSKLRYLLFVIAISLFLSSKLLMTSNGLLNANVLVLSTHPPTCTHNQVKNELLGEKPSIGLQHNTKDVEIWKLLYCCVRSNKTTTKTFCGRYGCCPISCYSRVAEFSLDVNRNTSNVFFLETSEASSLNYRQACSVESLAKHNPKLSINVLFTGKRIDRYAFSSTALLKNYRNVQFRSLYPLGDYFTNSPLEHWYFCSGWNYGPYSVSHLSDALRFLTLFTYGGYYFDSDIIFIRSLPNDFKNFVVYQNDFEIAAGTVHIEKGHPFSEIALEEFATEYRADDWVRNGPDVVRRTMARLCKNSTLKINQICQGVALLSREIFYPVPWQRYSNYFDKLENLPNLNTEFNGAIVGAHVWNKFSAESLAQKQWHQNQLYTNLAYNNCPNVFDVASDIF